MRITGILWDCIKKGVKMEAAERFIRLDELMNKTGLGRSTIYRMIDKGEFPKPINLTSSKVAWLQSEVTEWMRTKVEQRNNKIETE